MAAVWQPDPEATLRRHLDHLTIADPEAARRLQTPLADLDPASPVEGMDRAIDTIIEALAVETSYGHTLADGVGRILAGGGQSRMKRYLDQVTAAAAKGPTLATLMARHLPAVLTCPDEHLAVHFEAAVQVMLKKGTYTLNAPLETLSGLIDDGDIACAHAFLDLLTTAYALDTTYNRTVYLTHTLARAVAGFARRRRLWQIQGLTRIMGIDERLADGYLQGLAGGLHLLSEPALDRFLDQAIGRYDRNPDAGGRFLSLESRQARETCQALQVAVPLSAVRSNLERYLSARTGLAIGVRPLSTLSSRSASPPLVRCDGRAIYLPDEMDLLDDREANAGLYKLLVRLEAGAIEFGTFDLDTEMAVATAGMRPCQETSPVTALPSDLERLIRRFDRPDLALDLFTLFEHARTARSVRRRYPGLFRRLTDAQNDASLAAIGGDVPGGTLYPFYRHLVMQVPLSADPSQQTLFQAMADRFNRPTDGNDTDTPNHSVCLTLEFYPALSRLGEGYIPLQAPFGRRFDPDRFGSFHAAYQRLASEIKTHLNAREIRVYRSDIQCLLVEQNGQLDASDLYRLIAGKPAAADPTATTVIDLPDLEALICRCGLGPQDIDKDGANAFRYREWDWCMGDYLPDRVRLLEHEIHSSDPGFYRRTLDTFHGLVRRIRYAFELLRPEEITILRQWREGDAFDYRALLDWAIDRKAGLIPSDRLFIKRVKRIRDVATLLLVDLSRSTANTVDERGTRVLDVEKQAIVLLCEALQVVGDRFAVAGFSGSGPLGVDYYRIKDLEAPFDDAVKSRISAMAPQRSTRMGAAIRHATALLQPVQARVRLIIILGDGFPNDLEYKGPYAVEDTRRAVMEARAAAVHVKAITVNISDNGQLDRLYGSHHHTLIGNVRDLPDKLVRVYSALTRH
ncbi:VWA domain-containing protein [Desulfosarcina ovata]|uniref:VWFA domain-containing protein n=1 Tax=Desulfosarcina ovata subsp. ovata TaxID=2752305 RepID=A0A5K8AJV9_9BACT|nr:VWA domain-containing protein [Desulfosarcina ovata]BBO91944.1 hypothetical protein DSCOOX_51240 [Desulfosarcina ovata subsp. ovata]